MNKRAFESRTSQYLEKSCECNITHTYTENTQMCTCKICMCTFIILYIYMLFKTYFKATIVISSLHKHLKHVFYINKESYAELKGLSRY